MGKEKENVEAPEQSSSKITANLTPDHSHRKHEVMKVEDGAPQYEEDVEKDEVRKTTEMKTT